MSWVQTSTKMSKKARPPHVTDETISIMAGDPIRAERVSKYDFGTVIGFLRGAKEVRNNYELNWGQIISTLIRFSDHKEDCGTNSPKGSYAFANGCSCGLDGFLERLESLGFNTSNRDE